MALGMNKNWLARMKHSSPEKYKYLTGFDSNLWKSIQMARTRLITMMTELGTEYYNHKTITDFQKHLKAELSQSGFWKLQAKIFSVNEPLHLYISQIKSLEKGYNEITNR